MRFNVGVMIEQQSCDVDLPLQRCYVQDTLLIRVAGVDVGAGLYQGLRGGLLSRPSRGLERRELPEILELQRGVTPKQCLEERKIAVAGTRD